MPYLSDVLLLGYVLSVAVIDTTRHRIPNVLTVPAAAAGLLLGTAAHGADGLLAAAGGLLSGLLLFLPFYLLGGFGAGDVKALAAAGSFLGAQGVMLATVCTLITGGIGATAVLLAAGGVPALRSLLRRWMFHAFVAGSTGRAAALRPDPQDAARRRFPYGIAIACGVIAAIVLRG